MKAQILTLAMLTGCAAPQFHQHLIDITSSPPGAMVALGSKTICTTPCKFDLRDDFGFLSVYTFKASKLGYKDASLSFAEPTIFHAHGVVPGVVHFELTP